MPRCTISKAQSLRARPSRLGYRLTRADSSVAVLVSLEKGFTSEHLEYRSVDLLHGANFAPAYLRISPRGPSRHLSPHRHSAHNGSGTVPALVIPYAATKTGERQFKALTSTVEIAQFLDSSTLSSSHAAIALSPATVIGAEISNKIIEKIHSSEADPNFLLMSFRSAEERLAKLAGVPGAFLTGRQAALEKYAQEAGDEDARLAIFYENTIKANGGLLALYQGKGDSKEFVQKSVKAWNEVGKVLGFLEGHLEKTTYLLGDQISLADLHAGACTPYSDRRFR